MQVGICQGVKTTGKPTRVVGTCFFSFVMTYNNKKYGAIFGCHITFFVITQNP